MTITSLELFNFQRWDHLLLELDSSVTTLMGFSDAGKSTIIRALGWLAFNQPSGDAFIHWGCQSAKVRATIDDHKLTRVRGNKGNAYILDGQRFDALGREVPPAVSQLLNVQAVNFQFQHDSHFWLADGPAQISRNLNQVINLQEIDEVLQRAAAEVRQAKATVEVCEARLASARTKKQSLKWVVEFDRILVQVETTQTRLATNRRKALVLRSRLQRLADLAQTWDNALQAQQNLSKVVQLGSQLVQVRRRRVDLTGRLNRVEHLRYQTSRTVPKIDRLEELIARWQQVHKKRVGLVNRILNIERLEKELWQRQQRLIVIEQSLSRWTRCPACDSLIQSPSSAATST